MVQEKGQILYYKDDNFKEMPGRARDIAVGSDGSVFAIGWNKYKGGYGIWKWYGEVWNRQSGYGSRISVDNNGRPWVVTKIGRIFRKTTEGWKAIKGKLHDIAIGPEGSIVGVRGRKGVWKYNDVSRKWYKVGKFGYNVAVGPGGKPFITTKKGTIFWPEKSCPATNKRSKPDEYMSKRRGKREAPLPVSRQKNEKETADPFDRSIPIKQKPVRKVAKKTKLIKVVKTQDLDPEDDIDSDWE